MKIVRLCRDVKEADEAAVKRGTSDAYRELSKRKDALNGYVRSQVAWISSAITGGDTRPFQNQELTYFLVWALSSGYDTRGIL